MGSKKIEVDSGGNETAGQDTGTYRRFIRWAVENCLPMPPRKNVKISTGDEIMALGWLVFFVFVGVATSPLWLPLFMLREGVKIFGAIIDFILRNLPRGEIPFNMD